MHRDYVEGLIRRQLLGEWDYVTQDPVRYIDASGAVVMRENAPLPVGARIRIMEGEFSDMLAVITGVKKKRVTARLLDGGRQVNEVAWNVRAA